MMMFIQRFHQEDQICCTLKLFFIVVYLGPTQLHCAKCRHQSGLLPFRSLFRQCAEKRQAYLALCLQPPALAETLPLLWVEETEESPDSLRAESVPDCGSEHQLQNGPKWHHKELCALSHTGLWGGAAEEVKCVLFFLVVLLLLCWYFIAGTETQTNIDFTLNGSTSVVSHFPLR